MIQEIHSEATAEFKQSPTILKPSQTNYPKKGPMWQIHIEIESETTISQKHTNGYLEPLFMKTNSEYRFNRHVTSWECANFLPQVFHGRSGIETKEATK